MSEMFIGCESLKFLDLLKFNTNKIKDMHDIFKGCRKLNDIKTRDDILLADYYYGGR